MADEFDLEIWLNLITNDEVKSHKQMNKGVNGTVVLHLGSTTSYVTKTYNHLYDGLIRFNREITFMRKMQESCKNKIPSLIGFNDNNLVLCQEFIRGVKRKPTSFMVDEILSFIEQANSNLKVSDYPLMAANSMMKLEDLVGEIEARIEEEINLNAADSFFLEKIQEKFEIFTRNATELRIIEIFIADHIQPLLSPSDIGPHNMIDTDQGFKFIDFEFAGVDSNIKLACDLISHPDLHFLDLKTQEFSDKFQQIFGFDLGEVPGSLLALFRIKWSLLILKKCRKYKYVLNDAEKTYITDSI